MKARYKVPVVIVLGAAKPQVTVTSSKYHVLKVDENIDTICDVLYNQ